MQKTKEIQQELEQYIDPVKREYLPNFFKTGKGQYGEGDKFLGIVVPNTRMVAKRHKDVPFEVMVELLQSEWHECRLCALLMLVERFKKCDEKGKKGWTTGSLACASRAFPFPSCATGSVWLSCPLTGSWPQPSCAGEAGNGVPSAGRPLSPNPTGENTAPTAPGA